MTRQHRTSRKPRLPPAVPGTPLLGNLRAYRRDHLEIFRHGYARLGPVFSLRLGPQRAVVLIGPEHHRFFFNEVDRTLSVPELYRFVVPMFGRVLNAVEDMPTRLAQLELLHSAFRGNRMSAHVRVMALECVAWVDALGDSGEFELYDALSRLGMDIAAAALIGREVRGRMHEFMPLFEDLARGMDFVLPPNLPLPRFCRRDRARIELTRMIRPVIDERRANPAEHDDFLQVIVDESVGGAHVDDETAVGLALATLFTGYLTTAAQACWVLLQLLEHPDYLERVREELEHQLGDDPEAIDRHSLGRLELLERAIKESQRMHPVMSHYARYNRHGYTIAGYDVPAGWITMVCPAVAHRLPEIFRDPDTYDPDRFLPGRQSDWKHPYALIGFSAGVYRCPGAGFGVAEIKCIVAMLLRRLDLTLRCPQPRATFDMGVVRPAPPCRIDYRRRAGGRRPVASQMTTRANGAHDDAD